MPELSSEAWAAIIGGLVGAIGGGIALIAANVIQDKSARKQRREELRHRTYSDLLTSVMETIEATERLRADYHDGIKVTSEHVDRTMSAQRRLLSADANIRLIAPADTSGTARALVIHLGKSLTGVRNHTDDAEAHVEQIDAFVTLAKRDLGIKD